MAPMSGSAGCGCRSATGSAATAGGLSSGIDLALLSQLNGTPVADNRAVLEGIFLTDLRENRMAFGTADKPGYLLDALQQMHDFMLEQGVIKKRLSLKDALYFEGIQRFPQQ